jgi:hypothetical protein
MKVGIADGKQSYKVLGTANVPIQIVSRKGLFQHGLLQKQARPGLNPYIETLSGKRVRLMFIIQIRSDDNFRVADYPGAIS